MSSVPSKLIRNRLNRLRFQIRTFVIMEALLTSLVWVVGLFWVEFALDYFPVRFGFNELSLAARISFLVILTIGSGWLLFRFALSRLMVPLQDKSLALLIESKHPEFADSLVTAVDAPDFDSNRDLFRDTVTRAEGIMKQTSIRGILNRRRLSSFLLLGLAFVSSTALFYWASPSVFGQATRRIYFLENDRWPRKCHIEMVGFKVKRDNLVEGIEELNTTVTPVEGVFKIANGARLKLLVRAAIGSSEQNEQNFKNKIQPRRCIINYWTANDSGSRELQPVGAPSQGYQLYSLDGQPFEGVIENITFDIRADDHRIGPFEVRTVDEPAIVKTELDCQFPAYMVDETSDRWRPRRIEWVGRAELPEGTVFSVISKANKPLQKVYVTSRTNGGTENNVQRLTELATITETGFEFQLPPIDEPAEIDFFLLDSDGIIPETPYTLRVETIADQPPEVTSMLEGIGTAITPDAIVPISGKISDDYAIARQWIEIIRSDSEQRREVEIPSDANNELNTVVDFRELRLDKKNGFALKPGIENTVSLVVKAEDRYNLAETANLGTGNRFELDIVTPSQLLRLLEQQEVNQRRRLEQIYEELSDAKSYLERSKSRKRAELEGAEPEDRQSSNDGSLVADDPARQLEMRLLFSQRARLQVDKSLEEVQTVTEVFQDIRQQLINNRVDSEDRKTRLADRIISPLEEIVQSSFQQSTKIIDQLEESLKALQLTIDNQELSARCDLEAESAMVVINQLLREIDSVLGVLVKYETQNELLEIVRQLIEQQKEINQKTEKLRKREAFKGLLD